MDALLALTTFLADAAPPESVVRTASSGGSDLGVLVASLAGGAAVVAAATLLVWRRKGQGAHFEGEGAGARHKALGGVSLKLGLAWVVAAGLVIACAILLGPSRTMGVFAVLTLLILCPLLGATGTALGVTALALSSPTPRLRRWRALLGVALNVLPVFFSLFILLDVYRRAACLIC
jgi:hypothetical protein